MNVSINLIPITLDKNSPIPIYHQLQEAIKELIENNELFAGDRLPSETEFAHQFGISPMTVRHALNELVHEGYIYRKRGLGTFVAPRFIKHPLERIVSFSEHIRSWGYEPSSIILFFGALPATKSVAKALSVDLGQLVLEVKRLRCANDIPVSLQDVFLRSNIPITREEVESVGSIYRLLHNKNIDIFGCEDEICATTADAELSRFLDVNEGVPLMKVMRVSEDYTGTPVEYTVGYFRSDFFRYSIRLTK